jgi:cell wall-associated NlpC family hydrolase
MRLATVILLLSMAPRAWCAPPTANDDLDNFLADNGFVGQLQQMTVSATGRASELVSHAIGFLGVPYRLGGNNFESGFDCSGFVSTITQQALGLVLPRRAEQQAAATTKIDASDLQPGDLVFFNTLKRAFSHVGIYVGNGRFIHSPKPGAQVRIEDMTKSYWTHRFDGARRVAAPHAGAMTP